MKRFALLFCFALMGFVASAQMMPDSTVQVVASWNPGDKQAYNLSKTDFKVSDKDTTDLNYSTEIMILEVLSKTDTTYQLGLTYKDVYFSDPDMNFLYELMTKTSGDMTALITTDQYGVFKNVDNIQELISYQMSVIDPYLEILKRQEGANLDAATEARIREYIVQTFAEPKVIESSIQDDFGRMMFFHGVRMELGKQYTAEIQKPSILPGIDTPITTQMTVWIDTEKTDDISMHGCIYVPITKDRLMDFLIEYMKKVMSLAGMSSEAIDAEIANSTGVIEQMGLSSEEITDVGVHFATGWPLYVSNSRYVYSTVNGVNTTKQTHMEIEIILPE